MSALFLRTVSATSGSDEAREEVISADASENNTPAHYLLRDGSQSINFIEAAMTPEQFEGALRFNAMKYLTRYDKKGTPEQDLDKAADYIQRLRAHVSKHRTHG
jgi:hypothetical protein